MRPASLTPVVLLAVFVTGCHGKSNPGAPSPPAMASRTIASLVIGGVEAVLTGSSTNYTATAIILDGTTRFVTPTWSSSNTDVASVDTAGRLDGRVHGLTTLTATLDGISATKAVQVVNNYGGSWVGEYVINGCDAPPGVCALLEYDVFSFPIYLYVSQTGNGLNEISAILELASRDIRATFGGTVTSDGRLSLGGSSNIMDRSDRIYAALHVGAWDTNLSGRDSMTGRWAQRLSVVQPPYDEYQENELVAMTKIWPPVTSVSAPH
jgi:hypothetical protein